MRSAYYDATVYTYYNVYKNITIYVNYIRLLCITSICSTKYTNDAIWGLEFSHDVLLSNTITLK